MYPVNCIPQHPTWPIAWALSVLAIDLLNALLQLPTAIVAYILDVIRAMASLTVKAFSSEKDELAEPPYLRSALPVFGHLYNIFTQGSDYVKKLDQRYRLPLFTINVPGYRVYVAADPEAARAISRNPKTMEFTEIQRIAMRKLFDYPDEAITTLGHYLNGDGTLKLISKPGPELDEVNLKGQLELTALINSLHTSSTSTVKLCAGLKRILTTAICSALWGPDYPLLYDDSLQEDFWTWVHHFWYLLILPAHSLTVRKGHGARERLCAALLKYTKTGGHRSAAKVVSAEYHLYKSLGLGEDIIARAGTVSLFVVLSNTVMAGLWMVMMTFSRSDLLEQIRREVSQCTTTVAATEKHTELRTIDTTKLKTKCPVLLATLRETLRHYMDFSLNRYVAGDTHVRIPSTGETFLLRKDSIVQIASPLMQKLDTIWGSDTEEFKPCRFMEKPAATKGCPVMNGLGDKQGSHSVDTETRSRVYGVNNRTSVPDPSRPVHVSKDQKTAFGAFGAGAHTCPGRHFAFHIIAAFVAVLVSGFDIVNEDGGVLVPPETEKTLGHGVKLPDGDVDAYLTRRKGMENIEWAFEMS